MMGSVQVLNRHESWLSSTALAPRSRANYRRWVVELVEDLDAGGQLVGFLEVGDERKRHTALTDWRRQLIDRGLAPATVNLALAAGEFAPRVLRPRVLPSRVWRCRLAVRVRSPTQSYAHWRAR